jgi:hypothetical protein
MRGYGDDMMMWPTKLDILHVQGGGRCHLGIGRWDEGGSHWAKRSFGSSFQLWLLDLLGFLIMKYGLYISELLKSSKLPEFWTRHQPCWPGGHEPEVDTW